MKYILSIEGGWSRYVNLVPIPDKSTATVATALMNEFLGKFGMPAEIFSDQGKEFCNKVFADLKTLGKFEHRFSPAYSPVLAFLGREVKIPSALMVPEPGYPPKDEVENFLGATEVSRPMGLGARPQGKPRAQPPQTPPGSSPLGSTSSSSS